MQSDPHADKVGIEQMQLSQQNAARRAIESTRAALAGGDVKGATVSLVQALEGDEILDPYVRAPLAVFLARLLAEQGDFAAATDRLTPMLDYTDDRRSAVQIYCAHAVDLAYQGANTQALTVVARAASLASSDMNLQAQVDDVYAAIVPALVLSETGSADIPNDLARRVLHRLIERFVSAPNNLHLAHVVALLAERCAITADANALRVAILAAESGSPTPLRTSEEDDPDDAWQWAIQCWVLLAYNNTYWLRWNRHLAELRGEPAASDADLQAMCDAALDRIRRMHERLRDVYRQSDSPLRDPVRAKRHQRYLVALETERASARVLAEIANSNPRVLRSVEFVGPTAGIHLLAEIGRVAALQKLAAQYVTVEGGESADALSNSTAILLQCLSPFSPMYAMRRMGWSQEVEAYCRKRASGNDEPRTFLCSLLRERAEAALDGDNVAAARTTCIEALRLAPESDGMLALFVNVSEARVQEALNADRTGFEHALHLAKEDLAEAPNHVGLKAVVADVLRKHAQHLRDFLGDMAPDAAMARRIWALQDEAWRLDPDPELTLWTLWASWQLIQSLVGDAEKATVAAFEEAESVVSHAERAFVDNPEVRVLRVVLLRIRVDWHLSSEARVALLLGQFEQVEDLARDVERAWSLDHKREKSDEQWTATCLSHLATTYLPADAWPTSLAPYDAGLALVARGLRLIPGHPQLISTQSELLRLKAAAIIHLEGGFDGAILTDAVKRSVLDLFTESWELDASETERALAIARSCAAIGELTAAEQYALAAVTLDAGNMEARDLWAFIHAQPTYDAAFQDAAYGQQLIEQGQYRESVTYLRRADQTLTHAGYSAKWESFVELHGSIRHNLDICRQFGFG